MSIFGKKVSIIYTKVITFALRMNEAEIKQLQTLYEGLVRRNIKVIDTVCALQSGGDPERCNDLRQEVMLGLWLHLDRYRTAVPERIWVAWRARTIIYNYRRHRLPPPDRLAEDVADSLAEETYHCREQLEELTAHLPPEEQRLLRLRLEGYDVREIADRLGCSPGAVNKRMQRVIKKLRAINDKIHNK